MLVYGPFGIEEGDMGSIFGISWSMYNGYFPHRDFVYIKPAFSPYFHSLPLYFSEEYGYLINRYFYFVQVFIYSYLASKILFQFLKLPKKHLYFVALIGAMISIHNYPPMPWNTVDGIFFSVLGLYCIVLPKYKLWRVILGGVFLFLGALCKQSFYFFPLLVSLFLLYHKEWKRLIILVITGTTGIALFLFLFWSQNALEPFINQMFSFTSGSSLTDTGFKSYYLAIKLNILYIILALTLFWVAKRFLSNQWVLLLTNLGIAFVFCYLYFSYESFYSPIKYGLIHVLWVFALLFSFWKLLLDKSFSVLIVLLGLSWCASISNGYNTPIDFSIPMIFFVMLVSIGSSFTIKSTFKACIVFVYLATFFYGYQFPYREEDRKELNYSIGDVFPQLKTVRTHEARYEKFKELKALSETYDNFTILPSMTLGHYLTHTENPIGVDWVFNHHLADQLEDYKQKLHDKNLTVFIENFEGHQDNYEESSLLTMYVVENWKLIETRSHFKVYQQP